MYDMNNPEMILLPDVCYENYILDLKKIRTIVNEKDLEKKNNLGKKLDNRRRD